MKDRIGVRIIKRHRMNNIRCNNYIDIQTNLNSELILITYCGIHTSCFYFFFKYFKKLLLN